MPITMSNETRTTRPIDWVSGIIECVRVIIWFTLLFYIFIGLCIIIGHCHQDLIIRQRERLESWNNQKN
jgi:hypothetical protein